MSSRAVLGFYIARRFLVMIVAVYSVLMLLIFLVDFVELLRVSSKTGGSPMLLLGGLTLLRLPAYAELTLPFAALTGSIGAFLLLSRSSELVVMRAAGMSVWQIVLPGILVAFLLGVAATLVYNPVAANARAWSDQLLANAFKSEGNLLNQGDAGLWLRQDGADGPSVMTAKVSAAQGTSLGGVTIIQFDRRSRLVEQIEAAKAELKDGRWDLSDVIVARVGQRPERFSSYVVSTFLTPAQVKTALGSVIALTFWQLPGEIELAKKAGRSPVAYEVQYQQLLARPVVMLSMVLLAATVSLRTFRFGKIQSKVIVGLSAGFGFFIISEVSRQLGVAGLTLPETSAWAPAGMTCLAAMSVLLRQEDG